MTELPPSETGAVQVTVAEVPVWLVVTARSAGAAGAASPLQPDTVSV